MEIIKGNIWDYHPKCYIGITTNGFVKNNGECVMGAGIAKQAKLKYPDLPLELGNKITKQGNNVYLFNKYRLFTFPVKHNWMEKADVKLIEKSCEQLSELFKDYNKLPIYLVPPGCGNGELKWSDVDLILRQRLPSICQIVEWGKI